MLGAAEGVAVGAVDATGADLGPAAAVEAAAAGVPASAAVGMSCVVARIQRKAAAATAAKPPMTNGKTLRSASRSPSAW